MKPQLKKRLGDLLVDEQLISEAQLGNALKEHHRYRPPVLVFSPIRCESNIQHPTPQIGNFSSTFHLGCACIPNPLRVWTLGVGCWALKIQDFEWKSRIVIRHRRRGRPPVLVFSLTRSREAGNG